MQPARGVIGCLTTGFELLSQNLLLVALPVVLDFVLWLGPRVSVRPLLREFEAFLVTQQTAGSEMAGQVEQAVTLLEQFGGSFNLLSVLGSVPLFQVPSLLARRAPAAGSPLGLPHVISISSVLALVPWWGALALLGLVLGFLYLNEIAHRVGAASELAARRVGGSDEARPDRASLAEQGDLVAGVRKFFRFIVFALGLMVVGIAVVPLWILIVALGAAVAQPLGILLWVAGVGLFSYAVLHLLFVIPSLLLGGRRLLRAIGESVLLSHFSLSSVLGFVLLTLVIHEGLGYAWSLPRTDSWALAIGILGNAFVATGLTSATFVFYRERVILGGRLMAVEE